MFMGFIFKKRFGFLKSHDFYEKAYLFYKICLFKRSYFFERNFNMVRENIFYKYFKKNPIFGFREKEKKQILFVRILYPS